MIYLTLQANQHIRRQDICNQNDVISRSAHVKNVPNVEQKPINGDRENLTITREQFLSYGAVFINIFILLPISDKLTRKTPLRGGRFTEFPL